MRLSLFAAMLLAPLVLGGCDENPIGAGAPLVGVWETEATDFPVTAPNGSTNVLWREEWSFFGDGTWSRSVVMIDATTGRNWVLFAKVGSWRATDGQLRLVIHEEFSTTDLEHTPDAPVLVPILPRAERAGYELRDATLRIVPPCPIGVYCTGAALILHREAVAF
jgi:hypothetical protein